MSASRSGYVYLIKYPIGYKIGRSKKPWQRLRQLQGVSPQRLYLITSIFSHDAVALEKELDNKYCHLKDDRTEFYNLTDQHVSEIINLSIDT